MLMLITMMLTIGTAMAQEPASVQTDEIEETEQTDRPVQVESEPAPVVESTVADCEGVTLATFETADETAAALLMDLETEKLLTLELDTIAKLICLDGRLTPSASASIHGMTAMASLVDPQRDESQVRAALYAAGLASATYELPSIIPRTHKLRTMQADAAAYASAMDTMSAPEGSVLVVDGVTSRTRRIGAPAVVQIQTDGEISSTVYLAPAVAFDSGGDDAQ